MAISRRELLATVSSAALLMLIAHSSLAKERRGRLLLGLTAPVYFNGFSPFINWWKTASPPTLALLSGKMLSGREIWDAGGYLDPATGEIVRPVPSDLVSISRVFFKSANHMQVAAGCRYEGEEWIATWEGHADGQIEFLNGPGDQRRLGRNRIDFTTGKDPDRVSLVLRLTDRNDPPRNINIFQRRYLSHVLAGEKFNPDWLAQIRRFGVLRFMDWMGTNDGTIADFSQLAGEDYFAWCQQFVSDSRNGVFGPKGSIHPELICELANETQCNIHVCIPVRATDDFVRSFAAYFRDHTKEEVTYEFSNECWNPIFDQFHYCQSMGTKLWSGDFWAFAKWYGYRSAQCMAIIRDVYKDTSRWRGALATQTVDVRKTLHQLAGVNYWRKRVLRPARSLKVSDLFKSIYVTGYFGFGVFGRKITTITNSSPGICTAIDHGFKDGQKIKLFLNTGPTQLSESYVTVTNCTKDTFELDGVSTSGMGAYLPPCRLATSTALPQSPVYSQVERGGGASLTATRPGKLMVDKMEVLKGDKILVKDQPRAEQNGIYEVEKNGADAELWHLERVSYFGEVSTWVAGSSIRVDQGLARGNYVLTASTDRVQHVIPLFTKIEPNNYAVDAELFQLIDLSIEKHRADPANAPTTYTYFNQQVARAMRDGGGKRSLTISESVAGLEGTFWPRQLSIAQAYGLTLRQYEGGCGLAGGGAGLLGDPQALVYEGNQQFGEFVFQFGHSAEAAAVYEDAYTAFFRIGGEYPAKFVADGRSSNAGTWAGVRFWPLKANLDAGDTQNPVWAVVLTANG